MIPVDNLTIWGGYTQSYTTPGYNTTNIDFLPLRTLSDATVTGLATQGVYSNVYAGAFAAAVGGGADSTSAAGIADAQATGFLGTAAGTAAVDGAADGIRAGLPNNVGVTNGGQTEPTKYQTWELGFRANLEKTFAFESNFYYTTITDAIIPSNNTVLLNSPSVGFDGVSADYYLYGNYTKGIMYGTESTIKIATSEGVKFEVSHIYTHSEWELQENPDFDIHDPAVVDPSRIDQTPTTPVMPKHVFRLRAMFKLPSNFSLNTEVIYASKFSTQANYNYEAQRYPNILGSSGGVTVADDNSRTIINMKLRKTFMDKKLTTYIFGNDIFNEGIITNTNTLGSVTLSQVGGMYGVGISYKF